jgi:hypothetical protein
MANFRYSMRGRRSAFGVRRSGARSGHRPAGNSRPPGRGIRAAFGVRRFDSLPIAGLNCSLKIRLPMDAFPCMVSATSRSRHSSAGRAADL